MGQSSRRSLLCLVDEAGSLDIASPEPFRVGFLLTAQPELLVSDIRALKNELPPRGKSGEYHASEDHPITRARIRALLCLNDEPRMYIVEWNKKEFSPDFVVNGRLTVLQDTNPLIASFAITASHIAAAASANESPLVYIVAESSKDDIRSEHRSREQAFSQVIRVAIQKQAKIKRPPIGTKTEIHVSTKRKHEFPLLSWWLRVPLLVVSDGAPGLRKAIVECFPESRRQRCLFHKTGNIRNKLPQEGVDEVMPQIKSAYYQTDPEIAKLCASRILEAYSGKYPSARKSFQEDFDACIQHMEFPSGHQRHITTTNLLERVFEEQKRRTKIIPRFFEEKSCLKLVYATMFRVSQKWWRVKMSDYDLALLHNLRKLYGWEDNEDGYISKQTAA